MAVQAQWSLDTTAGSAFSLLSGVIQAATTDNVQAIALLACERFGSTLAMSDETMSKIETSVVPTPPSIPLRFLQASIGFSKHDCAAQLGKSNAGVRFLGLAAALITTMEPFQASQALNLMLSASAADPTQLPTLRQLRELLVALEPRCLTAGFADSVHGWELLVARDRPHRPGRVQAHHPSPNCVGHVVDSFRQIGRIGDDDITGITIETTRCGPWLIAFAKWCLGVPPSVCLEDGTPIIEQPQSLVRIYIMKEAGRGATRCFTVRTHRSLGGLNELVSPEAGDPCMGMVSIDVFGRRLLDSVDNGSEVYRQALVAAVPYAVCHALSNAGIYFDNAGRDPQLAKQLMVSPFPKRPAVERAMNLLLGPNSTTKLEGLEEIQTMGDIPGVRCRCESCRPGSGSTSTHCEAMGFFMDLSSIVLVVLGVSLFRWPEDLRFDIRYLERIIYQSSESYKASRYLSPVDILNHALSLAGHYGFKDRTDYVASAVRGQVVYPTIFETSRVRKHGFLSLDYHRGKLMYKNDEYLSVVGGEREHFSEYCGYSASDSPGFGDLADRPCNLFLGCRVSWEVAVGEVAVGGEILIAQMGLANTGKDTDSASPLSRENPGALLAKAGYIFMVENCGHDPSSPLTHPSTHQWRYSGFSELNNRTMAGIFRWVVAVDGSSDLRVFFLTFLMERTKIMIRERSCLSCCVEAAEKLGATIIVL